MTTRQENDERIATWFIIIGFMLCLTLVGSIIGIPMIWVGFKNLYWPE